MTPFPPPGADAALPAPAEEFFLSRPWFTLAAAAALPPGARPEAREARGLWLMLRRQGRRLDSLCTPYSQGWAPLAAPGADWHAAGEALGSLWRGAPPGVLEGLDPALPGLPAFAEGLRAAGLRTRRFAQAGQWHEAWPDGIGWEAYLAARPPALRNTLRRKLARAGRDFRFALHDAPGAGLEDGIAAFEAVRARSWKPHEPFPAFDAAAMRAAAPLGLLRLGVLEDGAGRPVAAQYWLLDRGGRRATVPKLFHDESARAASPGSVLTALVLQGLLGRDGVRELDFGRGDDPYKALWVARRRPRQGLLLADPRHPLGLLALARHAAGAARRRWRAVAPRRAPGETAEGMTTGSAA
ncbi:GNAT family N-acetyltransferase [Roseococcus sp. DSY-14]|uniref:GNAT family N-acetyltransferase n=1 Tax=Roseococcus sp. DSY-14 TaxID=3369650 RepID=UPI00387AEEFB